ncbi:hypothetical protein J4Q44_G00311880, partial [Coregonus suidteri]
PSTLPETILCNNPQYICYEAKESAIFRGKIQRKLWRQQCFPPCSWRPICISVRAVYGAARVDCACSLRALYIESWSVSITTSWTRRTVITQIYNESKERARVNGFKKQTEILKQKHAEFLEKYKITRNSGEGK